MKRALSIFLRNYLTHLISRIWVVVHNRCLLICSMCTINNSNSNRWVGTQEDLLTIEEEVAKEEAKEVEEAVTIKTCRDNPIPGTRWVNNNIWECLGNL